MNNLLILIAIILLTMGFFISCSSGSPNANTKDNKIPEKGKLIPKVQCNKDKSVNYALYIPSHYDSSKTYPLIIAFDSHADGVRPVQLFQNKAEEFSYIIAGSNNSKNGQAWPTTENIYNIMLDDLTQRFNVNTKRIYTAGFSGGSRVASTIAIKLGGISGVIGFSAGFPNIVQKINNKFDYLGIVGNADFNYNEMLQLDNWLENEKFNHYLILFDGTHEWAPENTTDDIFYWLEFCAMRNELLPKNEVLINTFLDKQLSDIKRFKTENNPYPEFLSYKKIISFLNGVEDISNYKTMHSKLEQNSSVQNNIIQLEKKLIDEQNLQQMYVKNMSEKDMRWWKNETQKINSLIDKNNEDALIYKRIYSYLSIAAYSYSHNALQKNLLEEATHYIDLYCMIDSKNPETAFLQTILLIRKADTEAALISLEKAIDLGFNDIDRMQNDTDIIKLSSHKEYYELIKKIKN